MINITIYPDVPTGMQQICTTKEWIIEYCNGWNLQHNTGKYFSIFLMISLFNIYLYREINADPNHRLYSIRHRILWFVDVPMIVYLILVWFL